MTDADRQAVLFANEAFYAAFSGGDVEAMEALWAKSAPLACLHPGATPMFDRDEIMESWRQILPDPGISEMMFHTPHLVAAEPVALVVCYETLGAGSLAATNGFVKENGRWCMVFHQAGPCPDAPEADEEAQANVH